MIKIVNGQAVEMAVEEIEQFDAARTVPLDVQQADGLVRIDKDVDAIYGAAIGNRQAEYERAEAQAQAYADAGYSGTVPTMVSSWGDVKGWTGQQAADDILQQATIWRGAQEQIRAERLLRKEQLRAAEDPAGIDAAMTAWAGFVAAARQQLGLGGA